tara:strand:+ start:46036 stop:46317 length:282 start_codon:yes stop_codon:yes gene_type:complete
MSEYYQPDPSEFCVGFEFEELWTTEGKSWTKQKMSNAADLANWMDTYAFDSQPEMYRVSKINFNNILLRLRLNTQMMSNMEEGTLNETKTEQI